MSRSNWGAEGENRTGVGRVPSVAAGCWIASPSLHISLGFGGREVSSACSGSLCAMHKMFVHANTHIYRVRCKEMKDPHRGSEAG